MPRNGSSACWSAGVRDLHSDPAADLVRRAVQLRLHGPFWHYLASGDFLRWNIQDGGDYFGGFGVGQLWFIMFLLLISLISIPLVAWGSRGRARAGCRASAGVFPARWWIVPVIILFLGEAAPEIPGGPFVYYLFIFVLGFIAVCDPRFMHPPRSIGSPRSSPVSLWPSSGF